VEQFLELVSRDGVYIVRLLVALVLGGLVGIERQTRGRSAGLRTNILVCIGSAAIIIAFQKLSLQFNVGAESIIRIDPARAAAGVITGIGFLGAGMIVKSKDFVRGLTTAASIWVVSAIGITVGLGEFVISVILTLIVLFTLYALHRFPINGEHYFPLQLKWKGDFELLTEITNWIQQEGVEIKNRSMVRQPKSGSCHVTLILRTRKRKQENVIFDQLQADERFDEVCWN